MLLFCYFPILLHRHWFYWRHDHGMTWPFLFICELLLQGWCILPGSLFPPVSHQCWVSAGEFADLGKWFWPKPTVKFHSYSLFFLHDTIKIVFKILHINLCQINAELIVIICDHKVLINDNMLNYSLACWQLRYLPNQVRQNLQLSL